MNLEETLRQLSLSAGGPGSGRHKTVFYHGTTSTRLPSILKNGLQPNSHTQADQQFLKHFSFFEEPEPLSGKISLAKSKDVSQWYARVKSIAETLRPGEVARDLPRRPMSDKEKEDLRKAGEDPDDTSFFTYGDSFIKYAEDGPTYSDSKPILLTVKVPEDGLEDDPDEPHGKLSSKGVDPKDIVSIHQFNGTDWEDVTKHHL